MPIGLGLHERYRTLLAFLGLERDLDGCDRMRMAVGVYAVARTVQCIRQTPGLDARRLFRLYAISVR